MNALKGLFADRGRRQSGSVLSGLLIIVAMLAILIGALMTELSSSFLLSRTVTERVQREATVNSAMEWAMYQLQTSNAPHVCVRDTRGPWILSSVNGSAVAVSQTCQAIMPDVAVQLTGGSFNTGGIRENLSGHNSYVVGNQAGRLSSYAFGTANLEWSINLGGAPTGQPLAMTDPDAPPHVALLVPTAAGRSSCGGHCVSLYDQSAGVPAARCDMRAGAAVTSQPAIELSGAGGPNFPSYAFFGDANGFLYVYDASTRGSCGLQATLGGLAGAVVGQPVVLTGTSSSKGRTTTIVDDIFVIVSTSATTTLVQWQYVEIADRGENLLKTLVPVGAVSLPVGGNATVSDPSLLVPSGGAVIRQAVAGRGGRMVVTRINVTSTKAGFTYTTAAGSPATLGGQVARDPYWCHCPGGDLIGVGSTNGFLYLLDTGLNLSRQYDGQADGRPAVNTTPVADAAGDWYFGADDGYVYDVEIPPSGLQMFKAARFGPGGAIRSSPIQGACGSATCLYFGSNSAGAFFANLAGTRVSELRACISSGPGSATCAANPRLWARVTVGPPAVVGGKGISIQGWSYYSP